MHDLSNDVPSYRCYGTKRRVRPLAELITKWLLRIVLIVFLAVPCLFFVLGLYTTLAFVRSILVRVLLWVLIAVLILFLLTRTLRKRLNFTRRLKRVCKKKGFSIKFEQNFFQSLIWSPDRQDFVLKTKNRIYYVRYLTLRHYRSTLFLEKPEELRLITRPLKNVFTLMFDVQPKEKIYPLKFKVPTSMYDIPMVKALVVNPVCEEIKYRNPNGGYEPTGSGGEHFGFTIFTGTGFIESLKRDA